MSLRRVRVFVYGSLLSGERNHGVLAGAPLVGAAITEPAFELFDLGGFPALVAEGSRAVVGEVYEVGVADLARLDRLEGHPDFYRRTRIRMGDGTLAEAYLLTAVQVMGRPVVESGDWRRYLAARAPR